MSIVNENQSWIQQEAEQSGDLATQKENIYKLTEFKTPED